MAALNAELQEYLAHSKGGRQSQDNGKSGSVTGSSWFGSSRPWSRQGGPEVAQAPTGWLAQAQTDMFLPNLTKKQRILGFVGCLVMASFCFTLAGLYAPFILLKARKFALLYSLGSVFVISSFSLLWGPVNHMRHLCSSQRLPFTSAYFGSMFLTLYAALWVKSTALTAVGAVVQIIALLWYIASYIPGGQTGLHFFTGLFTTAVKRGVSSTLPV
uniref:vesicle transport protein SFT2C isoform X1 n=1 Tax=Myxine glutinosa TaxID=7769 RepID=UPI00358F7998